MLTLYGVQKLSKGVYQLDKMEDVGNGNGDRAPDGTRIRWKTTPVMTGSFEEMEAESARRNREVAEARKR